jgi:hypothetical protein
VCILGFDIFVQEVIYKIIHPIPSWVGRIPFLITTADFEEGFAMSRLWDFSPVPVISIPQGYWGLLPGEQNASS